LGWNNVVPTTVRLGNDEVELTLVGGYTACGQVYTGQPVKLQLAWVWDARDAKRLQHSYIIDYPALSMKPKQVIRLAICEGGSTTQNGPAWRLASSKQCDRVEAALWCDPRRHDGCEKLAYLLEGRSPARIESPDR
jgi:hypothetical protein